MTAWVSSNSAGPFDVLGHFTGQTGSGSTNFDISAYISADTTVRFQNTNGTWSAAGDQFFADTVQIAFPGAATNPGVAGNPPNVASGYTIPSGTNLVVTFQVQVDTPSAVTNIINEACVTSDQRLFAVCSTVTNPLVPGVVGDFVWEDLDGDGAQDGGEPGISNAIVRLRDANSNIVATTTTDGSGAYLFTNVAPMDCFIEVVQPAGFEFTSPNQTNDTIDSDVNTNDGRTATFTLLAAETNLTLDAGLYQPASLGDFVWDDTNGDGTQDGGETGIPGVTVELRDANSNLVDTTTTDGSGLYLFTNLPPDNYFVEFVQPGGFDFSPADQTNDTIDSDANTNDGHTVTFALSSGETNLTLDAGLYQPAAIGDFIFDDQDTDGIQDAGEVGVNGVTVRLYRDLDGDGVPEPGGDDNGSIASTTTALVGGASGVYQFTGLPPGDYFVEVVPPAGFVISPQDIGGDDTIDSDIDPVTGLTAIVNLESGETDNTVDGGIFSPLDLSVTKSVNDAVPGTNQWVLWTVAVSNLGPIAATGIEYTDDFPTNLIFIGANASTGVYDSSALVWSNFGLAVGATAFLEITSQLDHVQAGISITNCVFLSGVDQADTNAANNSDCASVVAAWALIADFSASRVGGSVAVAWQTASEVGTAGFFLERLDEDDFERVTPSLLPGLINAPQGGSYQYVDSGAPTDAELAYRLIEIEIGGGQRTYGPYTVSVAPFYSEAESPSADYEATAHGLSAFETQRLAPVTAVTAGDGAAGSGPGTNSVAHELARIRVTTSGIQRIDAATVAGALGMSEAEAATAIASYTLALKARGGEVAYHAEPGGAAILFYGRRSDSFYCAHRVYWLAAGTGTAMGTQDGGSPAAVPGQTFTAYAEFEKNVGEMTRLFRHPHSDYYFWKLIVAGHATLGSQTFGLSVPGLAGGAAELSVRLYSLTASGVADEHHAQVSVNGTSVGSTTWSGATSNTLDVTVPAGVLVVGSNTVTVSGVLASNVPFSIFVIDSLALAYERSYTAEGDRLTAPAAGHAVLTVEDFSDADVVVVDVSSAVAPVMVQNTRIEAAGTSNRVSFNTASGEARYATLTRAAAYVPIVHGTANHDWLKSGDNAVDYLVITVPVLASAAQALADYRAAQGLAVKVVTMQEIYDCFSDGEASPDAISALLAYAHAHWARCPLFVVLAGSGSYDYRDYEGTGDTLVPPLLIGTPKGLFAADGLYGDVVGSDGVPEIMIGRLPARTDSELAGMVQRIQDYEEAVHSEG
ncbi:MAG: C25 family cysteine peptidase, partial [Verrucomicrobia bacterium]|nr:C25 family cysteine peptidase [Verrucomicrobiota bacterium]